MITVHVVQGVYFIEDHYRCEGLVKVFGTPEAAAAWIAAKQKQEQLWWDGIVRARAVQETWHAANPFLFTETAPPNPKKWPSGMNKHTITPEMRAERDAAKALLAAYNERYGAAHTAHRAQSRKVLEQAWFAEGFKIEDLDNAQHLPHEPSEFTVTEKHVEVDDTALRQFIGDEGLSRTHVRKGDLEVYLRKGTRFCGNHTTPTLTIADITMRDGTEVQRAAFEVWFAEAERVAAEHHLTIAFENVGGWLWMSEFLALRHFTRSDDTSIHPDQASAWTSGLAHACRRTSSEPSAEAGAALSPMLGTSRRSPPQR